jgi:peptidyl-prolyl cis-trans isomerase A (cyclophilin A)
MAITPTPASQPVIKNQIADIVVSSNTDTNSLNLLNNFDDPSTTGQAVRFEFYQPLLLAGGVIEVLLYDQADTGAPITVQNFLNYVNNNAYADSFIHRAPSQFVIQGGSFTVSGNIDNINEIPTNQPIQNEYSNLRDNILGTIAMAKIAGDPNSATSGWFFNMNDNTEILNENQNGGFTTFGQVIDDDSLAVTQAIADVPTFGGTLNTNQGPVRFEDLPLLIESAAEFDSVDDFVRLTNITPFQIPELTFSLVSNSNPNLVNVSFNGQEMILDYQGNGEGSSEITIQATNVFGQTVQDTFSVSINNRLDLLDTQLFRFQNTELPGTYLFVGQEERQNIQANFPQFLEEGPAFKVANEPGDNLIRFNRFQNLAVPGTYLYASEAESQNIRQNFPNFFEEGVAFYAFGADANIGVDFYRMQNTQVPGTYIFVSEPEKNQIEANFPNFVTEGVAFEVAV